MVRMFELGKNRLAVFCALPLSWMSSPPDDAWHGVYCILFLQGIGQLFPWNVFINAEEYFKRRFCGSVFEDSFENCFTLVFNIASIGGLLGALRYQEQWNLRSCILGSLAVSTATLVACAVLVLMEGASSSFLFFSTIILVFASGLSVAILQGGLFAMASALPPRYTQAMMAGQGLAGLSVSLAGLFTTLAGPDDTSCITGDTATMVIATGETDGVDELSNRILTREQQLAGDRTSASFTSSSSGEECAAYTTDVSTLVYFGIAVAVLLACMVSYPVLERLPLTTFYVQVEDGNGVNNSGARVTGDGVDDDDSCCVGSCEVIGESASSPGSSMHRRLVEAPPMRHLSGDALYSDSPGYEKPLEHAGIGTDGAVDDSLVARTCRSSKLTTIYREAFAVFFVFMVTLSVFPGATSKIVSSRECQPGRSRFFASDIFVLFSFVSFNAFDLLGRLAAGFTGVVPSVRLPIAALCRIVFVPLLLMCRLDQPRFRALLTADAFPLTLIPVFAFTNGYVGSLAMMVGSQKSAWAGTAMVLCLNLGLISGSLLSFLVLFITTSSS